MNASSYFQRRFIFSVFLINVYNTLTFFAVFDNVFEEFFISWDYLSLSGKYLVFYFFNDFLNFVCVLNWICLSVPCVKYKSVSNTIKHFLHLSISNFNWSLLQMLPMNLGLMVWYTMWSYINLINIFNPWPFFSKKQILTLRSTLNKITACVTTSFMHQKTVRDSTMHICTYIRKYELEVRIETFKKMWNKTFNNKYR